MSPRRTGIRWMTVAWAASTIWSLTDRSFGAPTGTQPPADRRKQMIAVLSASGPHASLGQQARVWDRFVGTWDCDFGFYGEDGSVRRSPGELEFGWVLDGRAIQDLSPITSLRKRPIAAFRWTRVVSCSARRPSAEQLTTRQPRCL